MTVVLRLILSVLLLLSLTSQVISQDVAVEAVSVGLSNNINFPLLLAAEQGNIKNLQNLVSQGEDINQRNALGLTAAHQASFFRQHAALGEIIRLGANLNIQDNDGWTPLMTAASTGDSVIAHILLDGNANPLIHSKDNYLAHSYAAFANHPTLALQLANAALVRAILTSDFFAIFLLLADGANVNTQTLPGATALIVAAHAGQTDVVRRLLTVPGIHPDFQEADGWTALMFASYSGSADIVHALLDFGVDLDIRNQQGLTALDIATQFDQREIVHVLQERAAHVQRYRAMQAAEAAAKTPKVTTSANNNAGSGQSEAAAAAAQNHEPAAPVKKGLFW